MKKEKWKKDTKIKAYPGYYSINTCGVDTKDFFIQMGTNISEVSRNTGISRKALTGVPIGHAAKCSVVGAISYLEKYNRDTYNQAILDCRNEIQEIKEKIGTAWEIYLKNERLIDECRAVYGLKRDYEFQKRISVEEVLDNL